MNDMNDTELGNSNSNGPVAARKVPTAGTARAAGAPGWFGSTFARLAGVDPTDQTRGEIRKAAATGALMAMVAGVATASGTFFASSLLHIPMPWALFGGMFWASLILALDRLLLMTLDGIAGRRRFITVAVRITIAAVLGFVIAEPLVLSVFDREVGTEMASYKEQMRQRSAEAIAKNPTYGDAAIAAAQKNADDLQAQAAANGPDNALVENDPTVKRLLGDRDAAETQRRAQEQKVECENDGSCGTQHAGSGPEWQRKNAELAHLAQQVQDLDAQVASARADAARRSESVTSARAQSAGPELVAARSALKDIQAQRKTAETTSTNAIDNEDGFGARMDALDRVRDQRSSVNREYWLIVGVLVLIDTAVVLLKAMQRHSLAEETGELERQAELHRARLINDHQTQELEADLVEDSARRAAIRDAIADHHDEQLRSFEEATRRASGVADTNGPARLSKQADTEWGRRVDSRNWWRRNLPAVPTNGHVVVPTNGHTAQPDVAQPDPALLDSVLTEVSQPTATDAELGPFDDDPDLDDEPQPS